MRHYAGSLVIIASTLAFTATAPAENILSRGIGSSSCASFLGSVNGTQPGHITTTSLGRRGTSETSEYFSEDALYAAWIHGFLEAINKGSDDAHKMTGDYAGVDLWLRNWCQTHPADPLGWAVQAFVQAMHAR
jgi:hypothetical protein